MCTTKCTSSTCMENFDNHGHSFAKLGHRYIMTPKLIYSVISIMANSPFQFLLHLDFVLFCKFDHFQRGRQSKFCFHHHLKRVCQKTMEITTGNWNKVCHLQNIPTYVRIIYENRIMYFRFVTTDTSLVIESCFLGTLGGFTGGSILPCCFSDITTGAAVNLVR